IVNIENIYKIIFDKCDSNLPRIYHSFSIIAHLYSTSRCYEVQEPHPQPPPRKRGGGLRCTS
ncbi:MAG: hypothetical protein ACLBM4_16315, partial [Dolichospermum sp.]